MDKRKKEDDTFLREKSSIKTSAATRISVVRKGKFYNEVEIARGSV